jgi:hypothetical protein
MKNNIKKYTNLPLIAIAFLQQLANGNPRLVAEASTNIYLLRNQYELGKLTLVQYEQAIAKYIGEYRKC